MFHSKISLRLSFNAIIIKITLWLNKFFHFKRALAKKSKCTFTISLRVQFFHFHFSLSLEKCHLHSTINLMSIQMLLLPRQLVLLSQRKSVHINFIASDFFPPQTDAAASRYFLCSNNFSLLSSNSSFQ